MPPRHASRASWCFGRSCRAREFIDVLFHLKKLVSPQYHYRCPGWAPPRLGLAYFDGLLAVAFIKAYILSLTWPWLSIEFNLKNARYGHTAAISLTPPAYLPLELIFCHYLPNAIYHWKYTDIWSTISISLFTIASFPLTVLRAV